MRCIQIWHAQVSSFVEPALALRKDIVSRAKDAFATLKVLL